MRYLSRFVLAGVTIGLLTLQAPVGASTSPFAKEEDAKTILNTVAKAMKHERFVTTLQLTKLTGYGAITIHTHSAQKFGTPNAKFQRRFGNLVALRQYALHERGRRRLQE